MSVETLASSFQSIALADAESLPFSPPENVRQRLGPLGPIPRYLFRVYTPKSQGETNHSWVKSMVARNATNAVDLFQHGDKKAAGIINRHLRWKAGSDDNLVSWTSSLLFALVYIFHLHANTSHASEFEKIRICVVDTSGFPELTFMQDMDLIREYEAFDDDLRRMGNLRTGKRGAHSGTYYFGEYLSQGALNIEGRCQIVTASKLIEAGLYDIVPTFQEYSQWAKRAKPLWADPVLELRRLLKEQEVREITHQGVEAVNRIAQLFGSGWRGPVAAHLFALVPHRPGDTRILSAFKGDHFSDEDKANCSPERTSMVDFATLPEVQGAHAIMRGVYRDHCFQKIRGLLDQIARLPGDYAEDTTRDQELISKLNQTLSVGCASTVLPTPSRRRRVTRQAVPEAVRG